jgi:Prophage CP4-57 regulatory protein (AlpA)
MTRAGNSAGAGLRDDFVQIPASSHEPERTANFTQGTFPKPASLGGSAVGWLEAEVQQWLQRRIEASRKVKVWSYRCGSFHKKMAPQLSAR